MTIVANGRKIDSIPIGDLRGLLIAGGGAFAAAVAQGQVAGATSLTKFAKNPAVGAAAEDIWSPGATQAFLIATAACEIVSDSANDAAAGTGAQQVLVSGVAITFAARISETVTLNGVTPVALVNQYARIDKLTVTRRGTYATRNAGNITARRTAGPVTLAQIPLDAVFGGAGVDRGSLICIPLTQYGVLNQVIVGVQTGHTGTVQLLQRVTPTDVATPFAGVFDIVHGVEGIIGQAVLDLPEPIYLPPGSETWWQGACDADAIVTIQQSVLLFDV